MKTLPETTTTNLTPRTNKRRVEFGAKDISVVHGLTNGLFAALSEILAGPDPKGDIVVTFVSISDTDEGTTMVVEYDENVPVGTVTESGTTHSQTLDAGNDSGIHSEDC